MSCFIINNGMLLRYMSTDPTFCYIYNQGTYLSKQFEIYANKSYTNVTNDDEIVYIFDL